MKEKRITNKYIFSVINFFSTGSDALILPLLSLRLDSQNVQNYEKRRQLSYIFVQFYKISSNEGASEVIAIDEQV